MNALQRPLTDEFNLEDLLAYDELSRDRTILRSAFSPIFRKDHER